MDRPAFMPVPPRAGLRGGSPPGRLRAALATFRLPFLPLTLVCVFVGVAVAAWSGASLDGGFLALVLVGALAAHISVNTLNEYFDFTTGLDLQTVRTPYSGGSGALPAQPKAASLVLAIGLLASVLTIACGLWLVRRAGPGLIPFGLIGLALVYTYTQWLNRAPLLSLIAPGTGFALMVLGTDYVFAPNNTGNAFAAALPVFFLVNNLLLLNQYPDVDADRRAGRRHLPIVIGRARTNRVLGAFYAATYAAIIVAVVVGYLPPWALLGLGTTPLARAAFIGARRHANDIPALLPSLRRNAQVVLFTPLLLGVGLLIETVLHRG
jgi:1,4-dihydroxy-2-naphthoate octaprenyltransferase